jgi:hypothetical protein
MRACLAAVVVCLIAAPCALAATAEELSHAEQKLLQVLERTESGDLDPASAAAGCVGYLSALKDAEKMGHVVVGLLQVHDQDALTATCEALTKATATGSYSAERFRSLSLNGESETRLLELGRLIRALYFAHNIKPASTDAGRLDAAQRASAGEESELLHVLKDVERNPGHRGVANAYCQVRYAKVDADFPFSPLIEGLLEVPETSTAEIFCLTMVESVAAGELTGSDLIDSQATSPEGLVAMGELMRGLLIAHERLYAHQAQKPPQAQSCGCGQ